jgi:large subunit ribosomal protein L25
MLPLNIDFKERANFGKGGAKKLRKEGEVPCVVSSNKFGPISLSLPKSLVDKMVQSSRFLAHIFEANLKIEGKSKSIKLIPIKVDFHPVNASVLHIDFKHVAEKTVVAQVPVKIIGADKSPGLKRGGKLNLVRYHVPLKCNIDKIPENVSVNISKFGVGRSFFLSNVKFEKGIEMAYDCLILSITGRGRKDKAEGEGEEQASEAQTK